MSIDLCSLLVYGFTLEGGIDSVRVGWETPSRTHKPGSERVLLSGLVSKLVYWDRKDHCITGDMMTSVHYPQNVWLVLTTPLYEWHQSIILRMYDLSLQLNWGHSHLTSWKDYRLSTNCWCGLVDEHLNTLCWWRLIDKHSGVNNWLNCDWSSNPTINNVPYPAYDPLNSWGWWKVYRDQTIRVERDFRVYLYF